MPENPAQEAVDAVDKALDAQEKAHAVPGSPKDSWAKMQRLTTFLASLAALLTAVGALIKSCDHSVTENAYATLAKGMQQVQSATEQNHQDLVALHSYLAAPTDRDGDGVADGEDTGELFDAGVPMPLASTRPTPPMATGTIQFISPPASSSYSATRQAFLNAAPKDAGVPFVALLAPTGTLPPVHSAPAAWQPKTWPDVASGK